MAQTAQGIQHSAILSKIFQFFSCTNKTIAITPIKNVFEYIWKAEVDGLSDTDYNDGVEQTWNESTQDLIGGGDGNATLPTSGRLVYYIVRQEEIL